AAAPAIFGRPAFALGDGEDALLLQLGRDRAVGGREAVAARGLAMRIHVAVALAEHGPLRIDLDRGPARVARERDPAIVRDRREPPGLPLPELGNDPRDVLGIVGGNRHVKQHETSPTLARLALESG